MVAQPEPIAERKARAAELLAGQPELSDREIGRRSGVAAKTVVRLRAGLEAEGRIPAVAERLGRDGRRRSAPALPTRQAGELSEPGLGELLGDAKTAIFGPAEQRRLRPIANYLRRLAVALSDQEEFDSWQTPDDAARACLAVLGSEKATELASVLGYYAFRVVKVAALLKKGVTP